MKLSFGDFLTNIVNEVKTDVDLLASNTCKSKWEVLKHLKDRVNVLENAVAVINREYDLQVQAVPKAAKKAVEMQDPPSPSVCQPDSRKPDSLRVFTSEELAEYTGRGGKPAYVAVNAVVYEVSDNPAFAAGTHFGLSCGKDLTPEYTQCHVGSDKLEKLKIVGRLA